MYDDGIGQAVDPIPSLEDLLIEMLRYLMYRLKRAQVFDGSILELLYSSSESHRPSSYA